MRQKRHQTDVTIVGAGIAGLSAALAAADEGASVTVLAKAAHTTSNSYAAQGGVAAAVGEGDDPAFHAADTLAAGRGICRSSGGQLPRPAPRTRSRPVAGAVVGAPSSSSLAKLPGESSGCAISVLASTRVFHSKA